MICKNCGNEVAEGFMYCTTCGAQLDASEPQPAYEDTGIKEPAPQPMADTGKLPNVNAETQTANDPGKTLGIVALILGIVSLVTGGFPAASVVGIILGSMGKKKSAEAGFANGPAKIGVILSIIGLILCVLLVVFYIVYYIFILGLTGAMNSSPYYY